MFVCLIIIIIIIIIIITINSSCPLNTLRIRFNEEFVVL
jgi:hypothetical protein